MWLLLVAAGSGYLARCWQHAEKAKHAHLHHATHTEPEEPKKRRPLSLAGNTPPNSPATRVPRSKSFPARVSAQELLDEVADKGLLKEQDSKNDNHHLQAGHFKENVRNDKEDLINSGKRVSDLFSRERSSLSQGALSSGAVRSLVVESQEQTDEELRYLQAVVKVRHGSEGLVSLIKEPSEESRVILQTETHDPDLRKASSLTSTALPLEETYDIVSSDPDQSEAVQGNTDVKESAALSKDQDSDGAEPKAALDAPSGVASCCKGPEVQTYFRFQAQRKFRKARLRKDRTMVTKDQNSDKAGVEICGKTGGKERVSLFVLSGKRSGDSRKNLRFGAHESTWATLSGKRTKDGEESMTQIMERHSNSLTRGLLAHSDGHLELRVDGSYGKVQGGVLTRGSFAKWFRTPNKLCKGRPVLRKARGMRASPKPISSLESCLSAQVLDDLDRRTGRRVARPLDFSASVEETGQSLRVLEEENFIGHMNDETYYWEQDRNLGGSGKSKELSGRRDRQECIKVMNLAGTENKKRVESLRTTDSKLSEISIVSLDSLFDSGEGLWTKSVLPRKKRKICHTRQLSSASSCHHIEFGNMKDVTRTPLEGLLFSFGVNIGVMASSNSSRAKIERFRQLLKEAESEVQFLRRELDSCGRLVPDSNRPPKAGEKYLNGKSMTELNEGAVEEHVTANYDSVSVLVTENASTLLCDQMANLEAELEVELEHLTGQFADMDELELDGVADAVHGDLDVKGLPAQVDSDGDDKSPEVTCFNSYAVSPRELTRLLRKLQATRQEERVSELEADLETVQLQLETREKELHLWQERVRRLTELSLLSPVQGEDNVFLRTPSSGIMTPFERPSLTSDSEAKLKSGLHSGTNLHSPLQATGYASKQLESCHIGEKEHSGGLSRQNTLGKGEPRSRRDSDLSESRRHFYLQEDHPGVDRRLDFGDNSWVADDVCDEFLRSMDDNRDEVMPQDIEASQLATDCEAIFGDSQIEQLLLDSVQDLGPLELGESSVMGSNTPSVYNCSSAVSMSDGWDNGLELPVGGQHRAGSRLPEVSSISYGARAVTSARPLSPFPVSEISDGEDYNQSDTMPPFKYFYSSTDPRAATGESMSPFYWNREGGLGRAGANTPSDGHSATKQPMMHNDTQITAEKQQAEVVERHRVDPNPSMYNKQSGWESFRRPPAAVRSGWECQSRASESFHGAPGSPFLEGDPFCEESLVSEAEEFLGNMIINEIFENRRQGFDIVQEAQAKLACLEKDETGTTGKFCSAETGVSSRMKSSPRGVSNNEGKLAEEEEFELLRNSLPNLFETVRVSDEAEYK